MQTNLINICILGEKDSGKTVYSKTLCNKEYNSLKKNKPTISDTYYSICHNYNKKNYKINLIDTVGSDFIYDDTISKCTSFIIMFQFNNIESFNNISMYLKMIRNSNKISSPIIIVGNKFNYENNGNNNIKSIKKELKSYKLPFIFINSCCEYNQVLKSFELLLNTWEFKYDNNNYKENNFTDEIYKTLKQSKKNLFGLLNKLK